MDDLILETFDKPFEHYRLHCFNGKWTLEASCGESNCYTQRKFKLGNSLQGGLNKIKELHEEFRASRK